MAQVSLPYTLQAGQPENVNNLVANLNALVDGVNTVNSSQLAAGSVTSDKLASGIVPVGMIVPYAGSSAPTDWLLCNGDTKSQSTYAALYAVISTTYNTGSEGSGNFRLPDLRGRMVAGKGTNSAVSSLANNEGMSDVAYRRPEHRHTIVGQVFSDTGNGAYIKGSAGNLGQSSTGFYIGSDTADRPLDAPAYLVLNYIIRAV